MPSAHAAIPKFHFGLNVADLGRSVAFYRLLFGIEPAKHYDDYAKFELVDPPLVMSLLPNPQLRGGTLNHLGFRLPASEQLVAVQRRLEQGGVSTQREEGVECCYARQTKFWASDPDRNLWEMYVFEDDIDHRGAGRVPEAVRSALPPAADAVIWEHRFGTPVPDRIPHTAGSVDEVRFEGTWSQEGDAAVLARLAAEAFRVLRSGGKVYVHGLVSDRALPAGAELPGPASVVKHVPLDGEPFAVLAAAGFAGLACDKLANVPCFIVEGAELRELRLSGWKPERPLLPETRTVMYRGPFAEAADDFGNVYRCGERVSVDARTASLLQLGMTAEGFVFFAPSPACCGA